MAVNDVGKEMQRLLSKLAAAVSRVATTRENLSNALLGNVQFEDFKRRLQHHETRLATLHCELRDSEIVDNLKLEQIKTMFEEAESNSNKDVRMAEAIIRTMMP